MVCPLCRQRAAELFHSDQGVRQGWDTWRCLHCDLLFRDDSSWLSLNDEATHYGHHQNSASDADYCRFLQPAIEAISAVLPKGACGLDYGSGPSPVLAGRLVEVGFRMKFFDPIFSPQVELEAPSFDFISCTEVVEHFKNPAHEFQQFFQRLRPGGYLVVMTQIRVDTMERETFAKWYYRRDPTHIAFYSRRTFEWIANAVGLTPEFLSNSLVRFRKPSFIKQRQG